MEKTVGKRIFFAGNLTKSSDWLSGSIFVKDAILSEGNDVNIEWSPDTSNGNFSAPKSLSMTFISLICPSRPARVGVFPWKLLAPVLCVTGDKHGNAQSVQIDFELRARTRRPKSEQFSELASCFAETYTNVVTTKILFPSVIVYFCELTFLLHQMG